MNSSTSNFRRWTIIIFDFINVVIILAVIEVALQFTAPYWLTTREGGDFRSDVIEDAVKKAEKLNSLDAAIVGSSISLGVNTELLANALGNGAKVENFMLVSADSRGTYQMLKSIVLPNVEVERIIYVFSPHDISPKVGELNRKIPGIESYESNRLNYRATRFKEKNLFIYRYRGTILGSMKDILTGQPFQAKANQNNQDEEINDDFLTLPQIIDAGILYEDFEISPTFVDYLNRIYTLSQQNKAELVLLVIPTHPNSQVTDPDFQTQAINWVNSMEEYADLRGIKFINAFSRIDEEEYYRDSHHISTSGELPLTSLLVETLLD